MIDGCGLLWEPYSDKPFYYNLPGHAPAAVHYDIAPEDMAVHVVENYVPYLDEDAMAKACAATVGGASSSASGSRPPAPAGDDELYSDSEPAIVLAGPRRVRPVAEPGDDEPLPQWYDRAHPVEGHEAEVTDDSEAESEAAHPRSEEELKKEAKSLAHMLLHKPKNKFCPACMQAKAVRLQARRVKRDAKRRAGKFVPTEFADLGTADHFDAKKELSQGACGQC
jgi:hypothetical protein